MATDFRYNVFATNVTALQYRIAKYHLWILLLQSYWLLQSCAPFVASSASREARNILLWPPGNTRIIQLLAGFGVPVPELTDASVGYGVLVKFKYNLANNISEIPDLQKRETMSRVLPSRWQIYSMFESVVNKMGFDGKACILKNICVAASAPLHYNGILGELLHIFLTPSSTNENIGRFEVNDFLAAERLGADGDACDYLYPECHAGIMDLFRPMNGDFN